MREQNITALIEQNANARILSEKTGVDEDLIRLLLKEGLDTKIAAEYIEHIDSSGVYLMDVTNACGDYTMLPIEFSSFVIMLFQRMIDKVEALKTDK